MSYLIENSEVVTKKSLEENEDQYALMHKYPLGDSFIVTGNSKPFFSIYDIANYCKKRYKKNKLFLIVHRYFDEVLKTKITEFYIFNSVNIFEKPLTSVLTLSGDEVIHKQNVIQNNINLAKSLLNIDSLHIILGDNVKEHEIVEYLNLENQECEFEIFNENEVQNEKYKKSKIKYETPNGIRVSRISKILKTIRILEPKEIVMRRYAVLIISAFLLIYFVDDYMVSTNNEYKRELKKEKRVLQAKLNKIRKNVSFEKEKFAEQSSILNQLKKKEIYQPE